jgi:hypothetical protein
MMESAVPSFRIGLTAAVRAWAVRLGVAAMLLHVVVAAFHHHDVLPMLSLSAPAAAQDVLVQDDQTPPDDGSDCAVCQILSLIGPMPVAALAVAVVACLLGLLSFCLADCAARRPSLVAGYPRAPPAFI